MGSEGNTFLSHTEESMNNLLASSDYKMLFLREKNYSKDYSFQICGAWNAHQNI